MTIPDAHKLPQSQRLSLRLPKPGDGAALIALNRASRVFHRGLVTPPRTSEQWAAYLARCQRDDMIGLLIARRSDDALLGVANISQLFRGGFQSAYLGYYLGAAYAGQGYMREALPLVLDYAFGPLHLHRLEANIQPQNSASIALVRGIGFRYEGFSPRYLKIGGRWRDHERWAILREDWRVLRRKLKAAPSSRAPDEPAAVGDHRNVLSAAKT